VLGAAALDTPGCAMITERRLRDYQAEDIDKIIAAWDRGVTRPAIIWATGLGKSDPIGFLAVREVRRGGRVVLLAHRDFLLTQLRDRVHAYDPTVKVGRVQAGSREYDAPIVVATVQTASRADRLPHFPRPTLVIVDEAHHAAAKTYEKIMRALGCYDEESPTRALGVTATMARQRARGLGLGDVWQEPVAERPIAWGIEHGPDPAEPHRTLPVGTGDGETPRGWLAPIRGRAVVCDHVDLSKAKISRTTRDYADDDLGDMVSQDAPEIVKAWWTEARLPDGAHRQTAVFVPSIAAAEAMTEAYRAAGVATELVTGKTLPEVRGDVYRRTGIYGRVADGRTTVLVSVGVLTEGFDCPPISCIVMARPTLLDWLYQQCVGRGTRQMDPAMWLRHDGTPFHPKDDLLVLDVVGMTAHVSLRTLVDLLPGAPYVDRPCKVCGQPKPCACPPEPDAPGRDPEGGRRRLTGPATYADRDMLADARASGLNWLRTIPAEGYEGIPFIRAGGIYGILWHNSDGSWSGGWVTAEGPHDGDWIIEDVDELTARDAVEEIWLPGAGPAGSDVQLRDIGERVDQPWRLARKAASPGQIKFLRGLGGDPTGLTAGACGDEIERRLATNRLRSDF
jgi:superfamily II DNA or RNA helicase